MTRQKGAGFTLIELSIVLVIISLIVGGIIGGKSLIESARLGKVINELGEIKIAINTFNTQFDAIPGDFREAEDYWGAGNTTNGNGNNLVDSAGVSAAGQEYEIFLFWEHLALSEIVGASYIGESAANPYFVPGVSIKASSLQGSGYSVCSDGASAGARPCGIGLGAFSGNPLVATLANQQYSYSKGVLTGAKMKSLDKKIDDGLADSGKAKAKNGSFESGCNTNPSGGGFYPYDLSAADVSCILYLSLE